MIQSYVSLNTAVIFENDEKGSIITSVTRAEKNGTECVYVGFDDVRRKDDVEHSEDKIPEVALFFNRQEDIDLLIKQLKLAKGFLADIEESKKGHSFLVPIDNILIDSNFAKTRPDPQKLVECCREYLKTGNWDREIIVDKNLVLKDGYVMYLVAKNLGIDKIPVRTTEGISILVGGSVPIVFTDEKIFIDAWIKDGFYNLKIRYGKEAYRIFKLSSVGQAVEILIKIAKVFFVDYNLEEVNQTTQTLARLLIQHGVDCVRPKSKKDGECKSAN